MSTNILSATALALLLSVGAVSFDTATAQNGGEARDNDRDMKKALDDKHLTPIRPIRRVGPDSWPAAKDPNPTNIPRETTGQASNEPTTQGSAKQEAGQRPAQQPQETAKQDAKPQPAPQDTAKQQPAPQDTAKQNAGNSPAATQNTAKQDAPKPDAAKQDTKQDTAKSNAAPEPRQQQDSQQAAQQPATDNRQQDAKQQNAPQQDAKQQDAKQDDKGFASIRLGTDAHGRVAVNDAQERQISQALRKQRTKTFDVDVTIGAVAATSVQLGAVSADLVAVLPQFRGYSFFATREEIVIVEPDSKKIVALVPVKLTATASKTREERSARGEERTTRGEAERTVRSDTKTTRIEKERDVTVGRGVPTEEEILAAPVVTTPGQTTVRRTYRSYHAEPSETVIIERRRPRIFGLW